MRKIWIVAALLALLVPMTAMAADVDQIYPDDMYLGKADAKVTVIEYASLSCPHCANFNADVLPQIKANYIDKGLVRWVYRDYPLNNPAYLGGSPGPLRLAAALFRPARHAVQDARITGQHRSRPIVPLRQIGASDRHRRQKTYDACLAR